MPPPHPDAIADCVLTAFKALPLKCKPRVYADGRREWVPLAGIVLSRESTDLPRNCASVQSRWSSNVADDCNGSAKPSLTCVALATGMKCLPRSKLAAAQGNILHDWHAEVLALRGFNRWLIDQCADLAGEGFQRDGPWLQWQSHDHDHDHTQTPDTNWETGKALFKLKENVHVHMYCSEAPCGDASMELTMAEQDDATPWSTQTNNAEAARSGESDAPGHKTQDTMLGRGHFDRLGIVRRKPSRPDAPITWSKSCSDKLALKQCTGLTNALASLLIAPMYLSTLVIPEDRMVTSAVERAWSATGRMKDLHQIGLSTPFKSFDVVSTNRRFEFEKSLDTRASNLAVLSLPNRTEVLINGVLQGRRQFDPAGASCTSRRRLWEAVNGILYQCSIETDRELTYADLKHSSKLMRREKVKHVARNFALKPWIENSGDEGWTL